MNDHLNDLRGQVRTELLRLDADRYYFVPDTVMKKVLNSREYEEYLWWAQHWYDVDAAKMEALGVEYFHYVPYNEGFSRYCDLLYHWTRETKSHLAFIGKLRAKIAALRKKVGPRRPRLMQPPEEDEIAGLEYTLANAENRNKCFLSDMQKAWDAVPDQYRRMFRPGHPNPETCLDMPQEGIAFYYYFDERGWWAAAQKQMLDAKLFELDRLLGT